MKIQDLIFRIIADASRFTVTMGKTVRDVTQGTVRVVRDVTNAANALVKAAASAGSKMAKDLSGTAAKMGKDMSGMFAKVGKDLSGKLLGGGGGGMLDGLLGKMGKLAVVAMGVTLALKGLGEIKNLGMSAIESAADFQDASTAFKVVMGSAEESQKLIKSIQQLAIATPFQSKELLDAGRQLLNVGVAARDVLPALKQIATLTAASGGGAEKMKQITKAYTDVMSKGVFRGDELKQFTEAGVPVQAFADVLGVSVKEFYNLLHAGEIGSEVVIKAFNKMTGAGGRFEGVVEEMSDNVRGRFNAIKESAELALQGMGLQLFDALKASGFWEEITSLVDIFKEKAPAAFKEISGTLLPLITNQMKVWQATWVDIEAMLNDGRDIVMDIAKELGVGSDTFKDMAINAGALPAQMRSIFYAVRGGIYAVMLPAIIDMIKIAEEAVAKFVNGLPGAETLGLHMDTHGGLFDDLKKGFEDIGKADLARSPVEDYFNRIKKLMAEAKKGADDAKKALENIGGVRVPTPLLPPDLTKFIDGISKASKESHGGGMNNLLREMSALELGKEFRQLDTRGGELGVKGNQRAFEFGSGKMLDELRKSTGGLEVKLPSAQMKGSSEAQDTINRSSQQQVSVLDEMRILLDRANMMQEERLAEEKAAGAALQELNKKNPFFLNPGKL